jgi:hypothetical protein
MSRYFAILLLLPFAHSVHGEEVVRIEENKNVFAILQIAAAQQTDQSKLYEAAMVYVHRTMKTEEQTQWIKKWEGRVEQASKDRQGLDEETYTRDTMYDFCSDNKEHFSNPTNVPKDKIIFLCMLYVRMTDRKYALPEKVVEKLTPENTRKVIKFLLEQQVAAIPGAKEVDKAEK